MHRLAAIALLAIATCASAQQPVKRQEPMLKWAQSMKCGNQAADNICAGHELALEQAKMAKLLDQEQEKLQGFSKALEHLAAAQAAWQNYSNTDCTFQAGEPGPGSGTGYPQRFAQCMQSHVDARIAQLRLYVACQHDGCWPKP
jgi:uncharacterized protein YecT (DUF1311 family)